MCIILIMLLIISISINIGLILGLITYNKPTEYEEWVKKYKEFLEDLENGS